MGTGGGGGGRLVGVFVGNVLWEREWRETTRELGDSRAGTTQVLTLLKER